MRKINSFVMVIASLTFIMMLLGCENKNDKMREFLHKYGSTTIGEAYEQSGFIVPMHSFGDLTFEIPSLEIKSDKIKEINGETYHFVKAKMMYVFSPKSGNEKKERQFVRWMALAIREDGFGNLQVDSAKSVEYVAAGDDERVMRMIFGKIVTRGEDLIK